MFRRDNNPSPPLCLHEIFALRFARRQSSEPLAAADIIKAVAEFFNISLKAAGDNLSCLVVKV